MKLRDFLIFVKGRSDFSRFLEALNKATEVASTMDTAHYETTGTSPRTH